jgi:ubiquinone/menaquinone biosynthesis C-methylase UbiE
MKETPSADPTVLTAYNEWHRQMRDAGEPASPLELSWYASVYNEIARYSGGKVLEIGCGRGSFALWLHQNAPQFSLTALDFSQSAIDIACERAAKLPSSPLFVQGDAQALPFDDDSFDLILSCECMEHVPDPRQMAREMARVLRSGGGYCLTTPSQLNGMMLGWLHSWWKGKPYNSGAGVQPHENFYFFWNVRRYLMQAGLTVERMESSTFQWLLLPGVAPHKLCTRRFRNPLAQKLAFPFGLHFSFFGRKL